LLVGDVATPGRAAREPRASTSSRWTTASARMPVIPALTSLSGSRGRESSRPCAVIPRHTRRTMVSQHANTVSSFRASVVSAGFAAQCTLWSEAPCIEVMQWMGYSRRRYFAGTCLGTSQGIKRLPIVGCQVQGCWVRQACERGRTVDPPRLDEELGRLQRGAARKLQGNFRACPCCLALFRPRQDSRAGVSHLHACSESNFRLQIPSWADPHYSSSGNDRNFG
jgi:hypothetical protein